MNLLSAVGFVLQIAGPSPVPDRSAENRWKLLEPKMKPFACFTLASSPSLSLSLSLSFFLARSRRALSVDWRLWETMRLAFDNRTSFRTLWRLFSPWILDRFVFDAREKWNARDKLFEVRGVEPLNCKLAHFYSYVVASLSRYKFFTSRIIRFREQR